MEGIFNHQGFWLLEHPGGEMLSRNSLLRATGGACAGLCFHGAEAELEVRALGLRSSSSPRPGRAHVPLYVDIDGEGTPS